MSEFDFENTRTRVDQENPSCELELTNHNSSCSLSVIAEKIKEPSCIPTTRVVSHELELLSQKTRVDLIVYEKISVEVF